MHPMKMGYVEGYKILIYDEIDGALYSPIKMGTYWDSPVLQAHCQNGCEHPGGSDCSCGLYASPNPLRVIQYANAVRAPIHAMLARVRGYGQVTEGDQAWRSEHMEVVAMTPLRQGSYVRQALLYFTGLMMGLLAGLSVMGILESIRSGEAFNAILCLFLAAVCAGAAVMMARFGWDHRKSIPTVDADEVNGIPVHNDVNEFIRACEIKEHKGSLRGMVR